MEEYYVRVHKKKKFKKGDVIFVCYSNYSNRASRDEINLWLFQVRQLPVIHKHLIEGVDATILEVISDGGALGVVLNTDDELGALMIPIEYALPSTKNMN